MEEHECDYPDTCPVCQGPKKPEWTGDRVSDPFPAKYDGHCPGCNLTIHKGEMIVMITEGANRHAEHHGCAL